MIKINISKNKTKFKINKSVEGETIETKCQRIENNKEPITDGAPIIYTERSAGVEPQYDIRTDRFEIALDAMDTVSKAETAKRKSYTESKDNKSAETESTQTTKSQANTETK